MPPAFLLQEVFWARPSGRRPRADPEEAEETHFPSGQGTLSDPLKLVSGERTVRLSHLDLMLAKLKAGDGWSPPGYNLKPKRTRCFCGRKPVCCFF